MTGAFNVVASLAALAAVALALWRWREERRATDLRNLEDRFERAEERVAEAAEAAHRVIRSANEALAAGDPGRFAPPPVPLGFYTLALRKLQAALAALPEDVDLPQCDLLLSTSAAEAMSTARGALTELAVAHREAVKRQQAQRRPWTGKAEGRFRGT